MNDARCLATFLAILSFTMVVGSGCVEMRASVPHMVTKRTQMHMGTLVTITAVAADKEVGNRAIQAAFNEIKRLEQLVSTWRVDSELSRVNAEAGHQPVTVSQETLELVTRGLEIARVTHGGFNIALGPAIDAWSVTERQHVPDDAELQHLKLLVDWTVIQVDVTRRTIYLPQKGMRIDIGGIGKGYAADRVVEVMKRAGAMGGVVALSGDIRAFGKHQDSKGFTIGIQHPRQDHAVLAILDLQDEAISTAGDYERFFERDGIRYHHILDPQTLRPARGCQSVTVIAKEGTVADGLDTGIFVLGAKAGMALVEQLPGIEAIIVDDAGEITVSSGLRHRVHIP